MREQIEGIMIGAVNLLTKSMGDTCLAIVMREPDAKHVVVALRGDCRDLQDIDGPNRKHE